MNDKKPEQLNAELSNSFGDIFKLFNQKDKIIEDLKNIRSEDQSTIRQLRDDIRVLESKLDLGATKISLLESQLKSKDDQIKLKDEEIKKLESNKLASRPTLKSRDNSIISITSSSPTKISLQTKSVYEPKKLTVSSTDNEDPTKARKTKSMFENLRLLPTQYSDTEDESSINKESIDKKVNTNSLSSRTASLPKINNKSSPPSLKKSNVNSSSPAKRNLLKSKSVYEPNITSKPPISNEEPAKARKAKSMIENLRILPTQYSDSEDETNQENINSSPINISFDVNKPIMKYSSDGKLIISPKKNMKPATTTAKRQLSPIKNKANDRKEIMGAPKFFKRQKSIELKEDNPFYNNPIINLSPPLAESTSPIKLSQQELSISAQIEKEVDDIMEKAGLEDEEVIADSQNEYEMNIYSTPPPTTHYLSDKSFPPSPIIEIPPTITTINLRRKFLQDYYTKKFTEDSNFKINLHSNPIKQISWDFIDFNKNLNYKPNEFSQFLQKHQIKDSKKFNQYKEFYNLNENWKLEDKLSQIFDKFESPPGFMKSDFPTTQELEERKQIIDERQKRRISRRIKSCITLNDKNLQVGEYIFSSDILNKYVIAGRWYIR
ncbi:hypothetical protein KGF54_002117 [Candida jiufengensis]|uniref:uncharacterized protein n=1 Tax=Candida jiufengensis TaxID=497108 RepID=UPI0022250C5C|nr:uncharacterized protein KGF54_002117 [Candida jiufengensis]KAI5954342.1 hypothetical protein KGF54_002117 [Candida jiufengensis]